MKTLNTISPKKRQGGAALAISLMILLVLTMVALSAMDGSSLGYKMGANAVYHEEAFNNSESGREPIGQAVVDFIEYGEWDGVADGTGALSLFDTDLDLLAENGAGEDQTKVGSSGLTSDLSYELENDSGKVLISAEVAVFRGNTVANSSGAGSAQLKGYHGAGVGIGGQGGLHKYFELRSQGEGPSSAASSTAADFRYVP